MKKIYSFLAVTMIVIVSALVLVPQKASSQNDPKAGSSSIPDDVNAIFKTACVGFHSDDGSKMAKMHVNLAKWDEYNVEKKASKAQDICKQVTKGSMPPKKFKKEHPDKVPTDAQVKMICDWANTLKGK